MVPKSACEQHKASDMQILIGSISSSCFENIGEEKKRKKRKKEKEKDPCFLDTHLLTQL